MHGMDSARRRTAAVAFSFIMLAAVPAQAGAASTSAARASCASAAAGNAERSPGRLSDGFEAGNVRAWSRKVGGVRASRRASFRGRYGLFAPRKRRAYVVRHVDGGRRVVVSFCWRVPRRGPVRIARFSGSDATIKFTRRRALRLRVRGGHVRHRRKVRLRARRWVAVRFVTDVAARRVELRVDGRLQAFARKEGLRSESSVALGNLRGSRQPVAIDGVKIGMSPSGSGSRGPKPPTQPPVVDPLGRPFSPTSFWNKPLADNVPLAPDSSKLVGELKRQVTTYTPWLNTHEYSTPVYRVPRNQPRVRVTLDTYGPDLQQTWASVPIPANAREASGTDSHMVVWQPSTDTMWEFWLAKKKADGWHARWGGTIYNASRHHGYFTHKGATDNWGATATGLPLLGGLITLEDLKRGRIDHALAIALVEAKTGAHVWPAQRNDGYHWTPGIHAVPEGTRFRLDPRFDVEKMNASPFIKMLARAAQRYGIVVRDKSGSVALYGEDPTPHGGANPWPSVWEGGWPNHILRGQFPWDRLQVVSPNAR